MLERNNWILKIEKELKRIRKEKIYRKRFSIMYGNKKYLKYKGKTFLNFSNNDYLGLSNHPKIIDAWRRGVETFGTSSSGSGHVIGYSKYHEELEKKLANWLGFDCAILFNSGFSANQSIIHTLVSSRDQIIADRLIHASLIEAAIHSRAKFFRFQHNNTDSLLQLLEKKCIGNRLILTEGVFSMDGDKSPIHELTLITRRKDSLFLVDDAHGIGVIGNLGKGIIEDQTILPDILVITFGKAFGVGGAALLCKREIAEYMLQSARHLIYSTAIPSAQVLAIIAAMKLVQSEKFLRKKLENNILIFKKYAKKFNITLTSSKTAIQPIIFKNSDLTKKIAKQIRNSGIWLSAILPPTVPKNFSRLRISLTASHDPEDIFKLLEILADAYKICNKR